MSRAKRGQKFLRDYGEMPTLWVEGTAAEMKPIIDTYTGVRDALDMAYHAAALGMNFRLDYYVAPVSDTVDQEEAHLTVFRAIRSDACIGLRQEPGAGGGRD